MSHELTERDDGKVEMAFTGPRAAIWHSLGQNLEEGASIESWVTGAGLDWEVRESDASFDAVLPADDGTEQTVERTFPDRKVLYRSDTCAALSIVGSKFKTVQPKQVVEFFRDLTEQHGMVLSTAGSLFGGKRFWALADTGRQGEVVDGDTVKGHLLLVTAVDGTMATTAKFVSTRVVCNNTLTVAMGGLSSKPMVKVTHRKDFDPSAVKIDLGVLDASWERVMGNFRKLAEKRMSAEEIRKFYEDQLFDPEHQFDDQSWGVIREVNRLTAFAEGGSGSSMSAGTAWGALCGATELYTHGAGKRDASHRFWHSYNGNDESKKLDMFRSLLTA